MLPNWLYGKSKSKLASILGGGGTPADYDQVKTQVTQNALALESVAPVEVSPVLSAHSVGDQFYFNGVLLEATANLAIGDNIIVSPEENYNTKIADKVAEQLNDLKLRTDYHYYTGSDISEDITLTPNNVAKVFAMQLPSGVYYVESALRITNSATGDMLRCGLGYGDVSQIDALQSYVYSNGTNIILRTSGLINLASAGVITICAGSTGNAVLTKLATLLHVNYLHPYTAPA